MHSQTKHMPLLPFDSNQEFTILMINHANRTCAPVVGILLKPRIHQVKSNQTCAVIRIRPKPRNRHVKSNRTYATAKKIRLKQRIHHAQSNQTCAPVARIRLKPRIHNACTVKPNMCSYYNSTQAKNLPSTVEPNTCYCCWNSTQTKNLSCKVKPNMGYWC